MYLFLINFIAISFCLFIQFVNCYSMFDLLPSIKCFRTFCCNDIINDFESLKRDLKSKLHGQHLVMDIVPSLIKSHMENPNPGKALVLSFHGWTGSGKNFASTIIAKNLYKESRFVKNFISTVDFPHKQEVEIYKNTISKSIKVTVESCERAMFIFDEIDKMPVSVLDILKPFLDYHDQIDGINYRKAIFIFLSNTGGARITDTVLKFWKSNNHREDISFKSLEEDIMLSAFNEIKGGLWHASLVADQLISAYVPFLPLERKHVKMCIQDELDKRKINSSDPMLNSIADMLQYYPEDFQVFSKSGCKRITSKIDIYLGGYEKTSTIKSEL